MAGRKKTEAALEKETSIEENFARLEDIIKKLGKVPRRRLLRGMRQE